MTRATLRLAAAVRAAREATSLSQRALSDKSGVPQAQISRFENGSVDLRLSSLVSLARAMGMEVELVPRKALPAVKSIVSNTERHAPAPRPRYNLNDDGPDNSRADEDA